MQLESKTFAVVLDKKAHLNVTETSDLQYEKVFHYQLCE